MMQIDFIQYMTFLEEVSNISHQLKCVPIWTI